MRLVCPNCGAQYEVDERVIPAAGRDVQCSNCGHAWFLRPSMLKGGILEDGMLEDGMLEDGMLEGGGEDIGENTNADPDTQEAAADADPNHTQDAPEEASVAEEPDKDETAEEMSHEAATGATEAIGALIKTQGPADDKPEATDDVAENKSDDEDLPLEDSTTKSPAHENPAGERKAQQLDEGVREILREEATLEAEARRHGRERIETQNDLGLGDQPAAQERTARLRGLDVEDDTSTSGGSGARRDLLPNIEEINSSLEPIGSDDVVDDFADIPRRKGGFGLGFLMMIVLAVIIVMFYIYAPLISERAPTIAPTMEAYVGGIDKMRTWLDSMVQLALARLQ